MAICCRCDTPQGHGEDGVMGGDGGGCGGAGGGGGGGGGGDGGYDLPVEFPGVLSVEPCAAPCI